MGTMNYNAVLATTFDEKEVDRVEQWLRSIDPDGPQNCNPSELFIIGPIGSFNGERTIVMLPDDSKEGWPPSDWFDGLRQQFISTLEEANYEDGSSPWSWVEVGYGEYGQKVLRGNNKNRYSDAEYAA